MAIYHLSVKIISRSDGKSAVGATAYRSGEKLYNQRDGILHDYTRKRGIADTSIFLPKNAPVEYYDRETLWNAVEKIEKSKKAQLAREIEVALPRELTFEKNRELILKFVQETFVDEGMCADICIHDKKDGNPHAHVMLTMRPINEDGRWGNKQKKVYLLDENGNKIYDKKKRQYKCKSVPTTDWNENWKLRVWRSKWADYVNEFLKRENIKERIDNHSYAYQKIEQIPTIHLGLVASQMEKQGKVSERGNINREIRKQNRIIREIKNKILEMEEKMSGLLVERLKEIFEKIRHLISKFIVTEYFDVSNDIEKETYCGGNEEEEQEVIECKRLRTEADAETDTVKRIQLLEKCVIKLEEAGIEGFQDLNERYDRIKRKEAVEKIFALQKSKLEESMYDEKYDYYQIMADLKWNDFEKYQREERKIKESGKQMAEAELKEEYGEEFSKVIFEEAVARTEEDLFGENAGRDREKVVREIAEERRKESDRNEEYDFERDEERVR